MSDAIHPTMRGFMDWFAPPPPQQQPQPQPAPQEQPHE